MLPNGTVNFAAQLSNATNTAVTYSVNGIPGGNSTVGTISGSVQISGGGLPPGFYIAPASPPVPNTVTVTVTSVQDPSKSASALVVIANPPTLVSVTVTPSQVTLLPGAMTAFTAAVTGATNTSVSWAVNGVSGGNATVGIITQLGIYTAPATVPSQPSVTVTATSLADPSAVGQGIVNIGQQVTVSVAPTVANVSAGMSLNLTAVVTGSLNTNVVWTVAGVPGGNSTVGTVSSSGVYTAPSAVPTPATVAVTATSVADPTKSASTQVTVIPPGQVAVSVAPAMTAVAVNGTQQFMATVTGTANMGVTWSVNGGSANGTISSTGLFTAPSGVPFPNTVTVTATSVVANASGAATVRITGSSAVNVNVAPAASTIQIGSTQQFTATVTGTTTTTVTWSVNGLPGGSSAIGTISASGLYSAPATVPSPATVMITATSTAFPSSSGTAALTITPPPAVVVVNITPTSGSLKVASQFQFTATVSGTPPGQMGVNWSVNGVPGGNASVGTISSTGLFVAPTSVPNPAVVNVTATSQFQPSASATSNITILPLATISLTPTSMHVQVGLGAQLFATVTGLANTAVTFKINGIPGGNSSLGTISTGGLYFAPALVPSPSTVTVTATSVADPTLVATSMITIDPLVTVVVNPPSASISLGGTQAFTATVTGTSNAGVNWSVNNIAGGNSTIGTINSSGLYTAPTNLLFPSSFTVTATSVVDPAAQGSAQVNVAVNPMVLVNPATASVGVNGTVAFTATVTGTNNTAVNWMVSGPPNPGTISAMGVYTAPSVVPNGPVTITAQSQAIPTATGTATVTVVPVVGITLTPPAATVNTGATQAFTATVTNTPNTAVTWTVNGISNGNASVGVINPATGIYTAPASVPTPATVTVTATSVADPTKSASSVVTVQPVITAITVSPSTASIATSATQQFAAMVTGSGNTAVTWQVNGTTGGNINTVGSISATGLYTAPSFAVVTTATNFTVTAVSVQNNTVSGSATVTVTPPPITVTVSPNPANLTVNAQQQFTATVTNAANPAVTWTVVGGAANGTITASGLYTAPGVPPGGPVTVQATSNQDPTKFGTATVNVSSAIAVTVSPANTRVVVGAQQQFTASVSGTANQGVTWSVSGGAANGTISATGLYTAPNAVPSPATVTVVATSVVAPNPSGSTTLTVLPSITVSVAPTSAVLNTGAQQTFTATVTGTANTAVTWSVNGVVGGNSSVGTINQATGQYTAPAVAPNPATVTVRAVSQADPTKSGSASVTIQGMITVTVSPAAVGVNINATQQFSATVTNASNTSVTWSVSGTGNVGSISATGLYTAPASAPTPATVTVTATSVQNGTSMGTAVVTVLSVVSISISPSAVQVTPNQQSQFTATVTGSANTTVTWSVNGTVGGNSTVGTISVTGLYTAPNAVPGSPVVTVTATSVADPTKSASAAVTITAPGAGIFVSVFPRNRNLPIGRPQQLKSHVFLTTNSAVNWFVNNIQNGDATVGTIDPVTAIYTPPAFLPANPNITIKAVSQADPTKSDSQNERVVAGVVLTPSSTAPHVTEFQQFVATVNGSANQSIEWQVNGIKNGNSTTGTITDTGLFAAPAAVPAPGYVTVSAVSLADRSEPAVSTVKIYGPRLLKLFPTTASVLPGWRLSFQYYSNIVFPSTAPSFGQVVTWSVNGIQGGNSTVGTISSFGKYTAPATPQTVTVSAQSTINPAFTAQATVNVTSAAGASSTTLLDSWTKVRPYDIVTGTPSLSIAAAQQEYADWQLLVTANGEDLSGVDVNVSNFRDGAGNVIPSSNATIYFEKPLNVFYPSRFHFSDVGEWPDPLIAKVDPFVHETRNAFPFNVNRISPAYKQYQITPGGNTISTGLGAGTAQSGGTYTGTTLQRFDIVIDRAGSLGSATYKWSTDGGVTFQQSNQATSTGASALADGVTVSFQAGNVNGVADFNQGDTFWIFAAPLRNQPVYVDLYVPVGTPAGNYTGTVTVTQSGKSPSTVTVNLQVYGFAIPVSSSFPNYYGAYWPGYVQAHFLVPFNSQITTLGHLYGTACLINRMSCNVNSSPVFTFQPNGTVNTANYTFYDQDLGPLANGTITPHGEQLSSINLRLPGGNDTQSYFAEQSQLAHLVANGWRSRAFDYTKDEPNLPSDFQAVMDRASLIRSVDFTFRTLVTTDISKDNFNMVGYISRWVPNFLSIGLKEYQRGPLKSGRSAYNQVILNGDDVWFYDSCVTQGCGGLGTVPLNDNYPNAMADSSALMNRNWGFMALIPYQVSGILYWDSSFAYLRFFGQTAPRVDVWESIYYFGGNGDGTFFYPGRPSNIGGTTDIPVESLRMKMFRNAFVDIEYGLKLQAQGDAAFYASHVLGVAQDLYTYEADPAIWANLRKVLGQKIK
ncbi:MAG: DUF4091 domain-containing protein [Acidipila sp.]|nr:DUF4091 domain-containing protein [Acidipila sp.]